jgi:hypothetical protein
MKEQEGRRDFLGVHRFYPHRGGIAWQDKPMKVLLVKHSISLHASMCLMIFY